MGEEGYCASSAESAIRSLVAETVAGGFEARADATLEEFEFGGGCSG